MQIVLEKFYGKEREIKETRQGREGKGEHDSERCEACKYGRCSHGEANNQRSNARRNRQLSPEAESLRLISGKVKWILRF